MDDVFCVKTSEGQVYRGTDRLKAIDLFDQHFKNGGHVCIYIDNRKPDLRPALSREK